MNLDTVKSSSNGVLRRGRIKSLISLDVINGKRSRRPLRGAWFYRNIASRNERVSSLGFQDFWVGSATQSPELQEDERAVIVNGLGCLKEHMCQNMLNYATMKAVYNESSVYLFPAFYLLFRPDPWHICVSSCFRCDKRCLSDEKSTRNNTPVLYNLVSIHCKQLCAGKKKRTVACSTLQVRCHERAPPKSDTASTGPWRRDAWGWHCQLWEVERVWTMRQTWLDDGRRGNVEISKKKNDRIYTPRWRISMKFDSSWRRHLSSLNEKAALVILTPLVSLLTQSPPHGVE